MEPTWDDLFRKWVDRLLDPGWTFSVSANHLLNSLAEVTYNLSSRRAYFAYYGSSEPRNSTACHEVCHILVGVMTDYFGEELPRFQDVNPIARKQFDDATEDAVENMVRAFMRAYGES